MEGWTNGWVVPEKNGKAETTEAKVRRLKIKIKYECNTTFTIKIKMSAFKYNYLICFFVQLLFSGKTDKKKSIKVYFC